MLQIKEIRNINDFNDGLTQEDFINFLHKHLDRFGDPKEQIEKSINYAFSTIEGKGGFLLAGFWDGKLVSCLVMNNTGMGGYIPENILVYVAVDAEYRGKGIGSDIIKRSFEIAKGDIKLHVEYDNPAKKLYERLGMTSKYAEMRLKR
ncbi:MAG: GNAT family N-acetyltransferase [Bacteroidales bacterium]|jgi:GNAT superfamily N-acetyltransferase|nr:GNAT family N-acetyltransferase [Bacteroidales bacterium]